MLIVVPRSLAIGFFWAQIQLIFPRDADGIGSFDTDLISTEEGYCDSIERDQDSCQIQQISSHSSKAPDFAMLCYFG